MVRCRGGGVSIAQITKEFRFRKEVLRKWICQADIEYENIMNPAIIRAARQCNCHRSVRRPSGLPASVGTIYYLGARLATSK